MRRSTSQRRIPNLDPPGLPSRRALVPLSCGTRSARLYTPRVFFQNRPVPDPRRRLAAQLVLVVLGTWLGALLLFGSVVAPAAFAVSPTPAVAGNLVARVLAALDWAGLAAGLSLAGASVWLGRGPWAVALPVLMSLGCLLSRLLLAPEIAALRPFLDDPSARARFGLLHGLSVGIFGALVLAALALVVLHVRALGTKKNPLIS